MNCIKNELIKNKKELIQWTDVTVADKALLKWIQEINQDLNFPFLLNPYLRGMTSQPTHSAGLIGLFNPTTAGFLNPINISIFKQYQVKILKFCNHLEIVATLLYSVQFTYAQRIDKWADLALVGGFSSVVV